MASFIKQQDEAKERFKKWEDERWQRNMEIEEERRRDNKAHDIQLFQMLGDMLGGAGQRHGSQSYFDY